MFPQPPNPEKKLCGSELLALKICLKAIELQYKDVKQKFVELNENR